METAHDAPALSAARVARWTLIASILGSSMAFIDGSVVTVALPSMVHDLGGGLAAQQWIIDAYLLTLGSLILVGGSLGDIFGELRVFMLGVASFAVVSVLCAVAPDTTSLIVFRGIQGVAGALLTPASLAMITATFTGAARGAAIGTWTSWTGISFIVGPALGGWLIDVSSWRVIFLINVPIALVTLLILFRLGGMRQKRRDDLRVDVPGAILCTAGLGLPSPASSSSHASAGAIPSWSAASWAVSCCSRCSSSTSCARRCRCCRSASSGCATSPSPTSRRFRSTGRFPA
jgi:MFS family permease